jgi:hypothetical protein
MSLFFVGEGRVSPPASGAFQPLLTRPRAMRLFAGVSTPAEIGQALREVGGA